MRVIFIVILLIGQLSALDFRQKLTLKTVKNIAMFYPDKRGETFENTAMAICMTETSGGKINIGDTKLLKNGFKQASYGIMQVRLSTARFMAKKFKLLDVDNMNDILLIDKLMKDNLFNAKIGVMYIVWCSNNSKSYFETVSRYNGGRVNHPYYNRVQKNMRLIKKYKL
jgi:hypothetical protein